MARGTTYGAILGPGGPSMARKIAKDDPGNQFLGDHRWHGSAPRNFIYTNN